MMMMMMTNLGSSKLIWTYTSATEQEVNCQLLDVNDGVTGVVVIQPPMEPVSRVRNQYLPAM